MGKNMTDMQLRQNIIDELDFDPSVDSAHIGVATEKRCRDPERPCCQLSGEARGEKTQCDG
jgi:hypothetical protein